MSPRAKARIAASAAVVFMAVAGCQRVEHTVSDVLTESATVAECVYVPSTHGSGSGPTYNMSDGSIGIASVTVSTEPKWAVVFQCEHGKFIVERKELWERMREGQSVTVRYREEYRVRTSKDGKRTAELMDYDFIDATVEGQ